MTLVKASAMILVFLVSALVSIRALKQKRGLWTCQWDQLPLETSLFHCIKHEPESRAQLSVFFHPSSDHQNSTSSHEANLCLRAGFQLQPSVRPLTSYPWCCCVGCPGGSPDGRWWMLASVGLQNAHVPMPACLQPSLSSCAPWKTSPLGTGWQQPVGKDKPFRVSCCTLHSPILHCPVHLDPIFLCSRRKIHLHL